MVRDGSEECSHPLPGREEPIRLSMPQMTCVAPQWKCYKGCDAVLALLDGASFNPLLESQLHDGSLILSAIGMGA